MQKPSQSVQWSAAMPWRPSALARLLGLLVAGSLLRDDVAFHLKARPHVFDCKYEKAFETDVHFRVLEAFNRRGIQPPSALHRSAANGPA